MSDVVENALSTLTETELPALPTAKDRVAWLLGKMNEQAPLMVRPMIRSLLLPKLEALDEQSLTETLVVLQTVILPWLVGAGGSQQQDDPDLAFEDDRYDLAAV